MRLYLALGSFAVASVTLFFLVAVLLKRIDRRRNFAFCAFGISVFVWSLGHMHWQLSEEREAAFFWLDVLVAGSCFIPYTYLHFVSEITERRMGKIIPACYGFALVLAVSAVLTDFVVQDVETRSGIPFWPVAGPGFAIYCGGFFIVVLVGFWFLFGTYKRASAATRNQLKYFILGTGVGFLGGATNFPLWVDVPVPPFAHGLSVFYILGIGYSALKFRLLDFNEVVVRLLAIVAGSVACGFVWAWLATALWRHGLQEGVPEEFAFWWIAFGAVSFVFILLAPRIAGGLENVVQFRLLPSKSRHREALRRLSEEVVSKREEGAIFSALTERLGRILNLESVTLWVRSPAEGGFERRSAWGDAGEATFLGVDELNPLLRRFEGSSKALFLEEEASRSENFAEWLFEFRRAHRLFDESDAVFPIKAHDRTFGFLILGAGYGGARLMEVDLFVLENLCLQVGLALKSRELERTSNQVDKLLALGTMSAGLAHELRNPLTSVRTLVSLLEERQGEARFSEEFVRSIAADVRRIGGIVEGVSAFAHRSSDITRTFELGDVVREAASSLREVCEFENIRFDGPPTGNWARVRGNPEQLHQVFANIFENSVNAIREWNARPAEGAIRVDVERRREEWSGGGDWVEVSVRDSGPGIPEAMRGKIFDPFVTTRDTGGRSEGSGTGLGLAITAKIVEYHHGRIWADAKTRSGARIVVALPETPNS